MKNTFIKEEFIEFLRFSLRSQDFERLLIASKSDRRSRFFFRMTQKVNNSEILIATSQNQRTLVHFISSSIAKRPLSELSHADLIPDVLFFEKQ